MPHPDGWAMARLVWVAWRKEAVVNLHLLINENTLTGPEHETTHSSWQGSQVWLPVSYKSPRSSHEEIHVSSNKKLAHWTHFSGPSPQQPCEVLHSSSQTKPSAAEDWNTVKPLIHNRQKLWNISKLTMGKHVFDISICGNWFGTNQKKVFFPVMLL